MPYQLKWYYEGRIAQCVFEGKVTIEEYEQYTQEVINNYLNVGKAPVHAISDVRQIKQFPIGLVQLNKFSKAWLRHPAMGWSVMVGNQNKVLNFLVDTVTQAVGIRNCVAATHEDALIMLCDLDPSLRRIMK